VQNPVANGLILIYVAYDSLAAGKETGGSVVF